MAQTTPKFCPICGEEVETLEGVCLMCGETITHTTGERYEEEEEFEAEDEFDYEEGDDE